MGYSGLGMQRWISSLKPRDFLKKRSNPDSEGASSTRRSNIHDFYHYTSKKMASSHKGVYTKAYKAKLNSELKTENRKENILAYVGVTIVSILITTILIYLDAAFNFL